MEYGKIIAVTGLPGLFELLSSKNDGAIVRSLEDKTTKFVSSRVHNFSHLESIEVFTTRDNVNLIEIFQAMQNNEAAVPDGKDGTALKKYFETIYPDLDFDRVYTSDLKKMAKWFEVLKTNEVEIKLTERTAEEEPAEEMQPETAAAVEESAPSPSPKKAKAASASAQASKENNAGKTARKKPESAEAAASPEAGEKKKPKPPAKKAAAKKSAAKKK